LGSATLSDHSTSDLRAALDPAIQDPNKAALLLNSAAFDRLGALALYLHSKKVI